MEKEETFTEEEEKKMAKARKVSIIEGSVGYGPMDGFGLRNITPYALAIGANNFIISLLSSLPTLLGNFSQFFTSRLMEKHPRQKLVFWSVLIQAFFWLLIIIPGTIYYIFNNNSGLAPTLLVIIYTALVIAGAVCGPAWSSWMKDLVPKSKRGSYFGMRNRICGAVALGFALIGGFILDYFKHTQIFIAFVILFFFAFVGRSFSAYMMTRQYEPKFKIEEGYYFSFFQFLKKMFYNNFGRFVIFVSLITLTSAVASPFFAVYLLNELNLKSIELGYVWYFIIAISASISTMIFMPIWGKFSDKYGNLKVMKITGLLIPLVPLLYFISFFLSKNISTAIIFIFFTEFLSGIIWAGFNLAIGNFIYDAVTSQRLALCLAYFNMLNGVGSFIGATLGGIIASISFRFFGLSALLFVFLLSTLLRFLAYIIMVRRVKEVRDVPNFDLGDHVKKRFKFFPNLSILNINKNHSSEEN